MDFIISAGIYGFSAAALGAAVARWLCWVAFGRDRPSGQSDEARRAAEVLVRLQELAARMAADVGEHNSQVEEINRQLIASQEGGATAVVDLVAKLIELNHCMYERLALTEEKLREQSEEIQAHAAEARTDALTLLANRRAFDDELARRMAEFRRNNRVFSLTFVDVDHFKQINDVYGHQVGDNVLRDIARLLRRRFRDMDMVARYGGEEFAIILPGTNLEEASRAAWRANKALEQSQFRYEGKDIKLTASFGVAAVRFSEDSETVIARVDRALYAAKKGGRNTVYQHDGFGVARVVVDEAEPLSRSNPSENAVGAEPAKIAESHAACKTELPAANSAMKTIDTSGLKQLASRTSFCQLVRHRTAEWKRGGPNFSLALVEVSEHQPGVEGRRQAPRETVVPLVSRFLAGVIREIDVAAEYAPGCIAVIFPSLRLADALHVADRVREEIAKWHVPCDWGQVRYAANVGVVEVMRSDDFLTVLQRAEAALDMAERRGGKRVFYHDGQRCVPCPATLEAVPEPA